MGCRPLRASGENHQVRGATWHGAQEVPRSPGPPRETATVPERTRRFSSSFRGFSVPTEPALSAPQTRVTVRTRLLASPGGWGLLTAGSPRPTRRRAHPVFAQQMGHRPLTLRHTGAPGDTCEHTRARPPPHTRASSRPLCPVLRESALGPGSWAARSQLSAPRRAQVASPARHSVRTMCWEPSPRPSLVRPPAQLPGSPLAPREARLLPEGLLGCAPAGSLSGGCTHGRACGACPLGCPGLGPAPECAACAG